MNKADVARLPTCLAATSLWIEHSPVQLDASGVAREQREHSSDCAELGVQHLITVQQELPGYLHYLAYFGSALNCWSQMT